MQFIHTSDWHLGRLFHNTSLLEDQRHLLKQLLQLLKDKPADALVIAGDIYDRAVPPAAAVELLNKFLDQVLGELGIPVLLIPGNHDSSERLGFAARHLHQAGLHIFSDLTRVDEPVRLTVKGQAVDFYGLPYADPVQVKAAFAEDWQDWEAQNKGQVFDFNQAHTFLVDQIQRKIAQRKPAADKNVLISHCFLDGASESESERPLALGGADRVDWQPLASFDYVALGHLHSPQYKGRDWIRYSGSLMKYSFSEVQQRKGVLRVSLQGAALHWVLEPLSPLRDVRVLEGRLQELLQQAATDPRTEDYLLVRLTDTHALLNPLARLREVYPQVLHLERQLLEGQSTGAWSSKRLERDELALFADFFHETRGEALNKAQKELLKDVIAEARKSE